MESYNFHEFILRTENQNNGKKIEGCELLVR